jgi:hypothetical protein
MKRFLKHILIFIGLVFAYKVDAQMLSVQARLDTNIILIGDQVKLNLEVNQPESFDITFPALLDTIVDKVEVLEDLGRDTIASDQPNQLLIRHKYLITSFDSGIYVFPPFEFTFRSNIDESIDTLATTPTYFGVMTMALDTANPEAIADIKLPFEAPLTFKEMLPYVLIGLALALVIAILVYIYIKYKRKEPVFVRKPRPKEPAHVIAYRDLDKLKREKYWQKNLVKRYHSELTEIIREYIEDRFSIRAMEQTSDEILESFRQTALIDSGLFNALEKMLKLADLVKFAKFIPLADENEQSLKDAYLFVDKTKQVFKPVDDESTDSVKVSSDEKADEIKQEEEVKAIGETNSENKVD